MKQGLVTPMEPLHTLHFHLSINKATHEREIKMLRNSTAEMASDISLEQEVFLSISLRDKRHFEDNVSCLPFYQNIEREGIAVYG